MQDVSSLQPASGGFAQIASATMIDEMRGRAALSKKSQTKECRLKDRFDRKALLAYQWDRSKIALDLDGVGVGFGGFKKLEGVKIEYKLRLQREKPPRERCRYDSKWQGLIGSGYNEFFVREDQSVWEDLRKMKKDAARFVDESF